MNVPKLLVVAAILLRCSNPLAIRIDDRRCYQVDYHPVEGSQIGHNASCPFELRVDRDPERVPETFVQQVCLQHGCRRSCGHQRHCVQLRVRSDFYYPGNKSTKSLVVNAGCVCVPHGIGKPGNVLELF